MTTHDGKGPKRNSEENIGFPHRQLTVGMTGKGKT